jgi:hypothetical protein
VAKKKRTSKKRGRTVSVSRKPAKDPKTGHFVKGNCGGPGNPNIVRLAEYRAAMREAVTPTQLRAVLRKLVSKAKGGDVLAAKVLLDRTLGKATAAPATDDAAKVDLPTLATTADTVAASNAILQALGEGRLSAEDAARYATIVELARRTLETHDLAERLAALEREAGQ